MYHDEAYESGHTTDDEFMLCVSSGHIVREKKASDGEHSLDRGEQSHVAVNRSK